MENSPEVTPPASPCRGSCWGRGNANPSPLLSKPSSSLLPTVLLLEEGDELRTFTEAGWPRAQHWGRGAPKARRAQSTGELSPLGLQAGDSGRQEALFPPGGAHPVVRGSRSGDSPGFAQKDPVSPECFFQHSLPERLPSQRATRSSRRRSSACDHGLGSKAGATPRLSPSPAKVHRWVCRRLGPKPPASLLSCHLP